MSGTSEPCSPGGLVVVNDEQGGYEFGVLGGDQRVGSGYEVFEGTTLDGQEAKCVRYRDARASSPRRPCP